MNLQEEDDDYYGFGDDFEKDDKSKSTPDELELLDPYYVGENQYENEDEKKPEQHWLPGAPNPDVDGDEDLIPEDPLNYFIPGATNPDVDGDEDLIPEDPVNYFIPGAPKPDP